jgi:hypothetical protein
MKWGRWARRLWPAPWSMLGLLAGALMLATGGGVQRRQGALEFHGGWLAHAPLPLDAITLGHVILGRNTRLLDTWRSHEQVHVRQYERWGLLFVPAYLGESAWQWLRGRRAYMDNRFERQARGG